MRPLFTCLALALFAFLQSASGEAAPGEGSQDTHKDTEQGGLAWRLGTWEGTRRDVGDGTKEPMVLRVAAILGGAGQTQEIEITHAGGVYRGFAVQIFDPETKTWNRRYVNAVRRNFASYEGRVESEGSVWNSVTPGRSRESRLHSRHATPAGRPERWTRTMTISSDGGMTWEEAWEDELVRVD